MEVYMPGPAPKPDDQRRRRNTPTFEWTLLPKSGRADPVPELPSSMNWSSALLAEWAYWWSTPQATAWDQSGHSLLRWAQMLDQIFTREDAPVSLHAQILAIEDRHGFTPAAMLKLRWRIVDSAGAEEDPAPRRRRAASARAQTAGLASRLRAVPPLDDPPSKPAAPKVTKPKKRPAKKPST